MAIHVMIKRKFKMNQPDTLIPLLNQMRDRAKEQEGYISTLFLQSEEDSQDFLVISRWKTEADWQRWFTSAERRDLQGQVDSLIGERTFYEVFKELS